MKKRKLKKKEKPTVLPEALPKNAPSTEDQRDRGYYYDDAHGYQKFIPQKGESEEDDSGQEGNQRSE